MHFKFVSLLLNVACSLTDSYFYCKNISGFLMSKRVNVLWSNAILSSIVHKRNKILFIPYVIAKKGLLSNYSGQLYRFDFNQFLAFLRVTIIINEILKRINFAVGYHPIQYVLRFRNQDVEEKNWNVIWYSKKSTTSINKLFMREDA